MTTSHPFAKENFMVSRLSSAGKRVAVVAATCATLIATTAGPALASNATDKLNDQLNSALTKTEQAPVASNPGVTLPSNSKGVGALEGKAGELTLSLPSSGKPLASSNNRAIFRAKNSQSAVTLESTDESVRSLIAVDSAFAPERWSFDVGGDVAKLSVLPDGGVIALDDKGGIVAGAPAPWAIDAKGKAIPTHFEVKGTTLTQVIRHRPTLKTLRTPTAYPVIADPSFDMNFEAALQRCAIQAGTTVGTSAISGIVAGKNVDLEGLVEPALNACIKGMTSGSLLANADFSSLISSLMTAIKTGNFDIESIDVSSLLGSLTGGSKNGTSSPSSGALGGLDLGSLLGGSDLSSLLGGSTGSVDLGKILNSIDLAALSGALSDQDLAKLAQQLLPVVIELLPMIIKMI